MRLSRLLAAGALAASCAACHPAPPPTRADVAARTDCRQQVDRQYNARNRADLTRRDERDSAFSSTYNVGIASRGLGAEYQQDQMMTDCLRAAGERNPQEAAPVGPVFSPANAGAGTSSLRP